MCAVSGALNAEFACLPGPQSPRSPGDVPVMSCNRRDRSVSCGDVTMTSSPPFDLWSHSVPLRLPDRPPKHRGTVTDVCDLPVPSVPLQTGRHLRPGSVPAPTRLRPGSDSAPTRLCPGSVPALSRLRPGSVPAPSQLRRGPVSAPSLLRLDFTSFVPGSDPAPSRPLPLPRLRPRLRPGSISAPSASPAPPAPVSQWEVTNTPVKDVPLPQCPAVSRKLMCAVEPAISSCSDPCTGV